MRRTYRYRLYPTRVQVESLEHQLSQACDLYNAALRHRRDVYEEHAKRITYYDQSAELKYMRAEGVLDKTSNCWSQQAVLRRLDRAFQAFFRRCKAGEKPGYPRFRSRNRYDTLDFTFGSAGGIALRDGRLRIQSVGSVKVKMHRAIPDEAKLCEARVTRRNGKWYASLVLDGIEPRPLPDTGSDVGIDLGVSIFAATSDEEFITGPRATRHAKKSVRRAQRKVSRRRLGSNRRRKAGRLLALCREYEANIRREHAHKTARDLIERYDMIAVEDLNIRNMVRSAKGTVERPGKQVAQKRGLNREIQDQGWGQFRKLLFEKAEDAARTVLEVRAAYTSQTCSECEAVNAASRSGDRFACTSCGHRDNAHSNAAKNILRLGWSLQALTQDEEVCVA